MAITLNGDTGITTPAETIQGNLTTTGNTILGDASTDTLNVGNGGLIKDASGNVGIGRTPVNKLDIGTSFTSQSSTGINASAKSIRIGNGEAGVLFTTDINTAGSSSGTQTSSAQVGYTYFSSTYPTDFVIGTNTQTVASNLRFYNNNSEVMRLDSSGNLAVGGTVSAGSITLKGTRIEATTNASSGAYVNLITTANLAAGTAGTIMIVGAENGNTNTTFYIIQYAKNGNSASVTYTGLNGVALASVGGTSTGNGLGQLTFVQSGTSLQVRAAGYLGIHVVAVITQYPDY
jgi:hypothetical protein